MRNFGKVFDIVDDIYINESEDLNEAARRSMSRIMAHMKGREFGVISAYRSHDDEDATNPLTGKPGTGATLTPADLNARHASLKADLKARGLSYAPAKGKYDGGGEKSLMVFGGKDKSDLKQHLYDLGKKYGQDSIIHKGSDTDEPSLHFTMNRGENKTGDNFPLGKMRAQKTSEFGHTELSPGGSVAGRPVKGNRTAAATKAFVFSNSNDPKEIHTPKNIKSFSLSDKEKTAQDQNKRNTFKQAQDRFKKV